MIRFFLLTLGMLCAARVLQGEETPDRRLPVRGLSISAPAPAQLDRFIQFIDESLGPLGGNLLILRVDFNFQYESHPELRDSQALSRADVTKIVAACRKHGIRIVPQINLLGHQSWANHVGKLLKAYPEFDETPWVSMPEKYVWPNPDGLYCKSYCPLHPKVHDVVFALVDEVIDAFEADAFHAGMDEVFYIGEDKCPRCRGKDRAGLFAGEVKRVRDHLAARGRQLWIWGDRLLDGATTGLGMWEASMSRTHSAIDEIPRDVVICDWHYDRAEPTAVYFAMKGFQVVSCPWKKPAVALQQVRDMTALRKQSNRELGERFLGVVQTVWSGAGSFLDEDARLMSGEAGDAARESAADCFRQVFREMQQAR